MRSDCNAAPQLDFQLVKGLMEKSFEIKKFRDRTRSRTQSYGDQVNSRTEQYIYVQLFKNL